MSRRPHWIDGVFLPELLSVKGSVAAASAERIIDHAIGLGLRPTRLARHDTKGEGFAPVVPDVGDWTTPVVLLSRSGRASWQLRTMRRHNPFRSGAMEAQLRTRLLEVPGMNLGKPDWPDVELANLGGPESMEAFLATLDWTVARIRSANPA